MRFISVVVIRYNFFIFSLFFIVAWFMWSLFKDLSTIQSFFFSIRFRNGTDCLAEWEKTRIENKNKLVLEKWYSLHSAEWNSFIVFNDWQFLLPLNNHQIWYIYLAQLNHFEEPSVTNNRLRSSAWMLLNTRYASFLFHSISFCLQVLTLSSLTVKFVTETFFFFELTPIDFETNNECQGSNCVTAIEKYFSVRIFSFDSPSAQLMYSQGNLWFFTCSSRDTIRRNYLHKLSVDVIIMHSIEWNFSWNWVVFLRNIKVENKDMETVIEIFALEILAISRWNDD